MNIKNNAKTRARCAAFVEAIPGSRGAVTVIAERVGVSYRTAMRYLHDKPTVKVAWEAEMALVYDCAERLIYRNIELREARQVAENKPVSSQDAWRLLTKTRRGRDRGFVEHQEVTGDKGGPLIVKLIGNVGPDDV
jgi:hypothetical protein